ncbi:MAG: glycosyltransferase [Candidatus Brockarchaeota archaeon]|nr:glycosyltransferase [Candidatus Brockarchaeota archaeon]
MATEGILVSVVTFDDWRPGQAVEEGVRVCRVTAPVRTFYSILTWAPLVAPEFVRASSSVIRGEGVDLIHSFEWVTGLPAITLKAVYRLPLVCTFHSIEAQRAADKDSPLSQSISFLEKELARESDVVTATNEDTARMLRSEYGLPEKASVIRFGVESDFVDLLSIYRRLVRDGKRGS